MTARFWCFTLNNPDGSLDTDFEHWLGNGLRYAVYQHEVGEEGTEHFQGYLELDRGQRMSYVQKWIPGAHLEVRKGSQQAAIDYCSLPVYNGKDKGRLDGPWTFGTPSDGQGNRADIAEFKKLVDSGASDAELWDKTPNLFLRHAKMLSTVRQMRQPKRNWKPKVVFCYGGPNTGKTAYCFSQCGGMDSPDVYVKPTNSKWWDLYTGQENIIIDEFKGWIPWNQILTILDRYPLQVEAKGVYGGANFLGRNIYITSNHLPHEWYDPVYPIAALTRRISGFCHFLPGSSFEEPKIEFFRTYESFLASVHTHSTVNPFNQHRTE